MQFQFGDSLAKHDGMHACASWHPVQAYTMCSMYVGSILSPSIYVSHARMQDNHLSDIQEGQENEAAAMLPSHGSPDSSSPFYNSSDMYHSSDLYTCTTRISDYSISDTPGRGAHPHTHGLQPTHHCVNVAKPA